VWLNGSPTITQTPSAQQGWERSQEPDSGAQVEGGEQVPFTHASRVLQQGTDDEHGALVPAQDAAAWQVPLVAPGGMSQELPLQQSALTVQLPPAPTQGGLHCPSRHDPEQQSVPVAQTAPMPLHAWGAAQVNWPAWKVQDPVQQLPSSAPPQLAPTGLQVETAAQRRTPSSPGTQGA
jgi:hypothetical protein